MKNIIKLSLIFITFTFFTACGESPATDAGTTDSASVKKMSTDSNSDMPIHTPKDSTEKMPNSLDSTKKLNSQ